MKDVVIILGSDHGGFVLKEQIRSYLQNADVIKNIHISNLIDVGTYGEQSCDYPDFVKKAVLIYKKFTYRFYFLGLRIRRKYRDDKVFIILTCSSGAGVSMSENKKKYIRALLCLKPEQAALAREHNKANCICFGQKFITFEEAKQSIELFLTSQFESGRHVRRISKM